ncbi:hypothetical protein ACYOEI_35585, partial [Singulisphaera rosea]
ERHAFHANLHSGSGKSSPVGPLRDFAQLYEVKLRKGTPMSESFEAMVKTSTWLGEKIGQAVADAVNSPKDGESRGRAKGALFRLRKTRTTADFMNELARLQVRYGIDVPKDVLDGRTLTPDRFEEFRGFCVVAALNRFLYGTREKNAPSKSSQ